MDKNKLESNRFSCVATAVVCVLVNGGAYGQVEETDRMLVLGDMRASAARLTPETVESRSGEATFTVDAGAGELVFELVSNIEFVTSEIAYPGGQSPITPANVDQFGGSYGEFAVTDPPPANCVMVPTLCQPGFHYMYTFDSQGVGDYTVSFVAPPGMGGESVGAVLTRFHSDSPIRAGLVATPLRVPDGQDVTLTVFVYNGSSAETGATVTAFVRDPVTDQDSAPFGFLDDGNGMDLTADDGVYTATFSPTQGNIGTYGVLADITGSGNSFERTTATTFETYAPPATFVTNPTISFLDHDDDADTLIDGIYVDINVDVNMAGTFSLTIQVEEVSTQETIRARMQDTLAAGANQTLRVNIPARKILALSIAGASAQFGFNAAQIVYHGPTGDDPAFVSDEYTAAGTPVSPSYLLTRFDRPDITATGNVTVSVDPLLAPFDELRVDVEAYVLIDDTYSYSASIVDSCGEYSGTIAGEQAFAGGIAGGEVVAQELNLVFPASMIGPHGVDGPYDIEDLVIYGPASYTDSLVTQTTAYAAADFVGYVPPPDCDGDGDPDRCEIVNGTAPDCNLDAFPDDCCSGDLDFDGFVNALDEGLLQSQYGCLATAGGCSLCDRSDLDGDGTVNPVDLGLLQAQSGPCGGLSPFDGGGPGDDGSPLTGTWQITMKDVAFEVQPAGGGRPIDVLEANTPYEIHYVAEHPATNGFALFAVTGSDQAGIESASAPPDGDWAQAGRLHFMDRRGDQRERRRAYGYSDEYHRNQQVTNNFHPYGPDRSAGPRGHLCNFTTAGAGELNLHLYLWMIDEAEQTLVIMESRVVAIVR